MISLTNYDFQWGRSEVVIIYPDLISKNWRIPLIYMAQFEKIGISIKGCEEQRLWGISWVDGLVGVGFTPWPHGCPKWIQIVWSENSRIILESEK